MSTLRQKITSYVSGLQSSAFSCARLISWNVTAARMDSSSTNSCPTLRNQRRWASDDVYSANGDARGEIRTAFARQDGERVRLFARSAARAQNIDCAKRPPHGS